MPQILSGLNDAVFLCGYKYVSRGVCVRLLFCNRLSLRVWAVPRVSRARDCVTALGRAGWGNCPHRPNVLAARYGWVVVAVSAGLAVALPCWHRLLPTGQVLALGLLSILMAYCLCSLR